MAEHAASTSFPYSYPPTSAADRWLMIAVWVMVATVAVFVALPIWV